MDNIILDGYVARYLKETWLKLSRDGILISIEAFDLRELKPPETYVSHFLCGEKNHPIEICCQQVLSIYEDKRFFRFPFACILNIEEVLDQINTDNANNIEYRESSLPHCGLFYNDELDNADLLEIKTTLTLLANENLLQLSQSDNQQFNNIKRISNLKCKMLPKPLPL